MDINPYEATRAKTASNPTTKKKERISGERRESSQKDTNEILKTKKFPKA